MPNLTRTGTICTAFVLLTGCPSDEETPPAESNTEAASSTGDDSQTETDADTDPGQDTEPDTDADTEGEPLPNDCSCYDPAVDVALGEQGQCLDGAEALPGCGGEPPPCDTILDISGDPVNEPELGPEEAILCVAERLAAGETPAFTLSESVSPGFGNRTEYLPLGDGRYAARLCQTFDSPPWEQSVETYDVAEGAYFTACIEDNADDLRGLLDCMRDGLAAAEESFPACG